MLLASKAHTQGNTQRWTVDYTQWLDNAAAVEQCSVTSSSADCTIGTVTILGDTVVFFLTGGVLGEVVTVSLTMTDNFNNVKNDTIKYTVVTP